jgi:hypothetical protein
MVIGWDGWVTPGLNNRIRTQPSTSGDQIAQIPSGQVFRVLEGPVCGDGYAWWRVQYNGEIGWTAEGEPGNYFIEPISPDEVIPPQGANCTGDTREYSFDSSDTAPNTWYLGQANNSTVSMVDGVYRLSLNVQEQGEDAPELWGSLFEYHFRSTRIEATIRASAFNSGTDRTGLFVRYQDEEAFLAFMIRSDGNYRITRMVDIYDDVIGWTYSAAIRTGDNATNNLTLDIRGDTFDFYVNGNLVDSVIDDTWYGGRIAFWGSTRQTPATFDLDYISICEY